MKSLGSGSGEDGADETPMAYAPFDSLIQEVQRGYELMDKLQTLLYQHTCTDAQIALARALLEEAEEACKASLSKLMPRDSIKLEAPTANAATSHDPVSYNCNDNERYHRTGVHSDSYQVITIAPYHDGHEWRKYGEKKISGFPFPRCYYRCTYKEEKGCPARKQVQQQNSDDPPLFMVTYRKEHTCNVGSAASYGILLQDNNAPPPQAPFFLQFNSKGCINLTMKNSSPGILNVNISSPQSLQANSTGAMAVEGMAMANQTSALGGMPHSDETFCGLCPSPQQLLVAGYVTLEGSEYSLLHEMESHNTSPLIGLW